MLAESVPKGPSELCDGARRKQLRTQTPNPARMGHRTVRGLPGLPGAAVHPATGLQLPPLRSCHLGGLVWVL